MYAYRTKDMPGSVKLFNFHFHIHNKYIFCSKHKSYDTIISVVFVVL